ncbi:MAG TPA: tetratricopeptide repeat protein [Terriglobales bacterium]|nr:tetratricopeptide repeat protein [Terriglobales bacterium]
MENRAGEATTLTSIGSVYYVLGEKQKALDSFNQALDLERAVGYRAAEATTLGYVAAVERNRGNLPEARARIEAALKIVESLRAKVASQELRTSYFSTVQNYYEFDVDILMRLHAQDSIKGYDRLATGETSRQTSLA